MKTLLECYSDKLIKISDEINKNLSNINSMNFSEELIKFGYEPLEIKSTCNNWNEKLTTVNNCTGVYIFVKNSGLHSINEENWADYKDKMKEKTPKESVPDWNNESRSDNTIFYVGKSNIIGSRVRQHMTSASPGTSALKLDYFKADYDNNLKYTVHIFYLKDKDQKKNAVSELVESVLHKKLSPNIGTSR